MVTQVRLLEKMARVNDYGGLRWGTAWRGSAPRHAVGLLALDWLTAADAIVIGSR
jgi:hypothetical protein